MNKETLSLLKALEKETIKHSTNPIKLMQIQNQRLSLIVDSLEKNEETGCLILPEKLRYLGTISYCGHRLTLVKAIYFFVKSERGTKDCDIPRRNIFRTCGNRYCYNVDHMMVGTRKIVKNVFTEEEIEDIIERKKRRKEEEEETIRKILEKQEKELLEFYREVIENTNTGTEKF